MEAFFELLNTAHISIAVGITAYVILELIDWVTGCAVAKVNGTYTSKISKKGLLIKACYILFYSALALLSYIINLEIVAVLIVPQLITTITSIYENLKEMKGEE